MVIGKDKIYDAIVVGAGHAGTEAALAIARCGYQVLLATMDKNAICRMSCNPAIGGLAKGHIVREIDALGGEMGLASDHAGMQFRMLNKSKGPAVWAPRAQEDKFQYSLYMKNAVESEKNITLVEDEATEILVRGGKAVGIRTRKEAEYHARATIVTTGTFMQGLIHIGEVNYPGGRRDEPPSIGLSKSLAGNGLEIVRFKTGTPCRIQKDTIDYSKCEELRGDENPEPFSFRTKKLDIEQCLCWLTYTNQTTHDIIRKNLHRSPLYAGRIVGVGPRYCPSIEDKVVKFADKTRHQIYLEPEGWGHDEIYANGLPTSLPADVQEEFVHTLPGLENCKINKYGYAIEYDCLPPTQLKPTLETKKIENLYLAGQVNCTSGYEEAAGQGIIAAYNVIHKFRGLNPFVLDRSEAYIGVMIDDLVTVGTNEPYRMFTSRAEFRLLLRQDNADERLMKYGGSINLLPATTYVKNLEEMKIVNSAIDQLKKAKIDNTSLDRWLRRPEMNIKNLPKSEIDFSGVEERLIRKIEWDVKYEGYIKRQEIEVAKFKKLEKRLLPPDIDYSKIIGIRREAKDKLSKINPASIGQASRIPGITSCDISLLLVYSEKLNRK